MIAFLISLAPFLPTILTVLGWVLKALNANAETIQKYEDLVKSTQNSGLISVNARDRMVKQEQDIIDEEKHNAGG